LKKKMTMEDSGIQDRINPVTSPSPSDFSI